MIEPPDVAYGVAGGVLVAFAAWLLYLSPQQRATRAFAAMLCSMALVWFDEPLEELVSAEVAQRLVPVNAVGTAGVGLAALYFLSVYPRPRGWLGRSPWGGRALLAVVVALGIVVALRPALFVETVIVDGRLETVETGPLIVFLSAWTISTSLMLLLLALDATRTPRGPVRRALLLVLSGFLVSGLVWSLALLLNDVSGRLQGTAITGMFIRQAYAIDEASFFPAVAAAGIVVAHAWRSTDPLVRREGHAIAALTGLTCAIVVAVTFAFPPPGPEGWSAPAQQVTDALAGVVIAGLAGYALLKHRLFDIDVKLRWTISRGTVAGVFLAVFFVAAQLAQNFLSESYGWMLGGAIAGVMLFAITPIQRVAERVANAAVPTPLGGSRTEDRRREVYRLALSVALADKIVTREEERHLARLAEELGIGHTEALTLRESVEREMNTT